MIPKECKRLAEVDFPIAEVSRHSAREKSIRHGHPSTLHLWWARRPLAACRAMLLALLLPDPCDPHCPIDFKNKARELLPKVQGRVGPEDKDLQKAILKFIGNFSNWDLSSNRFYLEVGRGLVKAAHPEETPLVVDPFAGGGSIPLEALRLGCDTFASDLNPVACLILKVMLEDIPRYGRQKVKVKRQNGEDVEADGLAEALRIVGKDIKEAAEKELAEFYPKDPDGSTPIAYLWARTVRCESPNCGAEIPLMRSFWLCKKANRKRALWYKVTLSKEETPKVEFDIFEPKSEKDVPEGTVTRAKARCLCCGTVLPPERVRAQLAKQHGGADVIFKPSPQPSPDGRGGKESDSPSPSGRGSKGEGLCPVPDESTPIGGGSGAGRAFSVQEYGMMTFGDLFTGRQKVALVKLVETVGKRILPQLSTYLAMLISKGADGNNSLCRWMDGYENPVNLFSRQALPIVWDFCESAPSSKSRGVFLSGADDVAEVIRQSMSLNKGQVEHADACESPLPSETSSVWFTDPPYYDAIPYSDLSDFFLVWLKRIIHNNSLLLDPFDTSNQLSPKEREAVQDETKTYKGRTKDRRFFEERMSEAFAEGRRVLRDEGIGSVVFAHKTTEGWEALLSGMIRGGWVITGSWPIATERANRLRSQQSAALATSVHLVCRPRPEGAPVGDWADVLRELPKRVGNWMERLQGEGIRGADLVFACIGPALEIFSRYRKVETAEGKEVKLPEYLEKVWEVVGRTALEQVLGTAEAQARNSAVGALEENARLTALFLWSLQSTNAPSPQPSPNGRGSNGSPRTSPTERGSEGIDETDDEDISDNDEDETPARSKQKGYSLIFDVVRRFAQPLGIDLPKWEKRIIETKKGIVCLLPVAERAKQLFGEEGVRTFVEHLEHDPKPNPQLMLFPEIIDDAALKIRGRASRRRIATNIKDDSLPSDREATTLDRVHAAMLLQASGQSNALRALLKAEQERSPDFLRLANALSALYPKSGEEKRLLDAMLLGVQR